jgi:hypothetical protein
VPSTVGVDPLRTVISVRVMRKTWRNIRG